ncbi:hypothetical protein BO94DRAFT_532178 [Aspergillus sclerotioniger CBS 115572]|uniref:Uncharacterized protein n=1 Tax=Aspergillus sclerotioniger CBS 115572 TaxID=1450535 RepID=A0A317X6H6_9EURO|nr:hypothetical protein BO94DRAFT_532178 [Aspergillus sclerotioniger CBS 115572]PWY94226.1 hypothetical protein BO94DRAFT_532178 [Aspergillus sclerotioniger CBS 115572]
MHYLSWLQQRPEGSTRPEPNRTGELGAGEFGKGVVHFLARVENSGSIVRLISNSIIQWPNCLRVTTHQPVWMEPRHRVAAEVVLPAGTPTRALACPNQPPRAAIGDFDFRLLCNSGAPDRVLPIISWSM